MPASPTAPVPARPLTRRLLLTSVGVTALVAAGACGTKATPPGAPGAAPGGGQNPTGSAPTAPPTPAAPPAPDRAGEWRTTEGSSAAFEAEQTVAGRKTGAIQRGRTGKVRGTATLTQTGDRVRSERAAFTVSLPAGIEDARFELGQPFEVPAAGGRADAHGTLVVKGQPKPVVLPVEVSFPDGHMRWLTTTTVTFSHYGVKPPSVAGGAVGVADEATVTVDLRMIR